MWFSRLVVESRRKIVLHSTRPAAAGVHVHDRKIPRPSAGPEAILPPKQQRYNQHATVCIFSRISNDACHLKSHILLSNSGH